MTREQSNTLKGLLIILIVLGHNHILSPNTEVGGLMDYLYMFHVECFFILPFFYQSAACQDWKRVIDVIVRNWWPYMWTCVLCLIASFLWYGRIHLGCDTLWAFLQGTQSPIRSHFGFVFPWFLPTYCSFTLLLMVARRWRWMYWVLFVASLMTWTLDWHQFYMFKNTVPFGLGLALCYFACGVLTYEVNSRWPWAACCAVVGFLGLTICWWSGLSLVPCVWHLMPVLWFLSMLAFAPYCQWNWLQQLGKCSLGIYLFHMFLVNIFCRLLPQNTIGGILSFLASLLLSWALALFINRNVRLRRFLLLK